MAQQSKQTKPAEPAAESRSGDVSRKQFLHTLARGGFMTAIMGVGAMALHGTREVSECFNHNYCDSCWAFTGCNLPEKKVLSEKTVPEALEANDERAEEVRPA